MRLHSTLFCVISLFLSLSGHAQETMHCLETLDIDWHLRSDDGLLAPYVEELEGKKTALYLPLEAPNDEDCFFNIDLSAQEFLFVDDQLIFYAEQDTMISLATYGEDSYFKSFPCTVCKLSLSKKVEAAHACYAKKIKQGDEKLQTVESENDRERFFSFKSFPGAEQSTMMLLLLSGLMFGSVLFNIRTSTSRERLFTLLPNPQKQGFVNILAVNVQPKDILLYVFSVILLAFCYAVFIVYADHPDFDYDLPLMKSGHFMAMMIGASMIGLYHLSRSVLMVVSGYFLGLSNFRNLHFILSSRYSFWLGILVLVLFLVFVVTMGIWPSTSLSEIWSIGLIYTILFILYLFLQLKNSSNSANLYIISYLCISEILPMLLAGRFLGIYFPI